MKKVLCLCFILVLVIGMSSVNARENTRIDLKIDSFGYCVIVTLLDSSNNTIANEHFDLNITKESGHVRQFHNQKLNKTGQDEFYLGNGEFKVDAKFEGNEKYSPSNVSRNFSIHKSDGNSIYDYYQYHDYGESVKMDDYMYDNFWYEEIYDDPYTFDGEGY